MNDQITIYDDEKELSSIKIDRINGKLTTTSKNVSEVFGKEHKNVLRDIEKLECSEEFRQLNFELSSYTNGQNKSHKMYIMTQDGWSFLVMGFTGEKAASWKEKYIAEFRRMRDELQDKIPKTYAEALQLAANQAKEIEEKNKKLQEARPKIETYNHIEASINSISIGEFANLLTKKGYITGQNRLFKWFYKYKYLIKSDRPYQTALDNGWFEIRKVTYIDKEEKERTAHKVLITGKGQIYFINKIIKDNT